MNKPVCIDSHLIIWGIKKEASKGQEHMIEKAENFFNGLIYVVAHVYSYQKKLFTNPSTN